MKDYTPKGFVFTTFYDTFDVLFYDIILPVILLHVSRISNELFVPVYLFSGIVPW